MKELSVEEKARRYDEVFSAAKEWYNNPNSSSIGKSYLYAVLPELKESKESEDERIISIFREFAENYLFWGKLELTKEKALAWLEAQGEHANFRNAIQIGDKVTRNKDGVLVNLSQLKRVAKPDEEYNITGIGSKHAEGKLAEIIKKLKPLNELEKQGEKGVVLRDTFGYEEGRQRGREEGVMLVLDNHRKYGLEKQGEQKYSWSEEDERIYQSIMDDTVQENQLDDKQTDWLKSLKERYTWKPSDKQMEAVRIAAEIGTANNSWAMGILKDMHQDLKKLREE